jgi:hypothetical protein
MERLYGKRLTGEAQTVLRLLSQDGNLLISRPGTGISL